MALGKIARYLRNNPNHTGTHVTLLILLCIACGVCGSQVMVPPKVSGVLGKNVTLSCRIQVDSNLTLTQSSWERRLPSGWATVAVYNPTYGISIQPEYMHRLSFHIPSAHDATVVLQNVGFSDVGDYTCKVATFPLGNTQASTTLSVLVEPKVYISAGSAALLDGGNLTTVATCIAEHARPPADVFWESDLYGTPEVHMQEDGNGTTTTQVHYLWEPTRHAQGDTLTCVVKHPALPSPFRMPYVINVQFAPDILLLGYDGDWYVGRENVQLKCQVKANPPAHYFRWIRLDGEMPDGVEVVNNSLTFLRPLQRNDSGVYRCEVGNKVTTRSRDLRIRIQDMSQKQMTSSIAVTGAVMGAVLALFLIIIFTVVLFNARKAHTHTHADKVIDLPPTHRPPPPYSDRPFAVPQDLHPVASFSQPNRIDKCQVDRTPGRMTHHELQNPTHHPLSYQEWICHQNGADRVYINHRELYV
ncbi:nectin-3-like protein isoform X4 [Silurus meridionalis]|nr:nectin-3-like protein isoform X4 [Silurus meridionalis]